MIRVARLFFKFGFLWVGWDDDLDGVRGERKYSVHERGEQITR